MLVACPDAGTKDTSVSLAGVIAAVGLTASLMVLSAMVRAADPPADRERGQTLAKTWCAGCHDVERRTDRQRADGVPSFLALASDPRNTAERLRAFLTRPHGRMPDLNLSRQERDDLIAYLLSLREGRNKPASSAPTQPRP